MNTIFIGIAGGTGSGKTTLTEHLAQRFGGDIAVVHHDNYYKRQNRPFEERCLQNYDHPDAFETERMVEDLKRLKEGQTIYCICLFETDRFSIFSLGFISIPSSSKTSFVIS